MTTRQSAHDAERGGGKLVSRGSATRRQFLTAGTSLATAMVLPEAVQAAALSRSELTTSDFRGVLNTQFRAVALSHPTLRIAALTLTEVTESPHPHPGLERSRAKEMAFSLKFAVSETGFAQDTYLLSHPTLGDFSALMVPTGNGKALRAEFHRL